MMLAVTEPVISEHHALERLLLHLLVVLALMVFVSLVFGRLFKRWGQPKEVGEILAGVLLGPSLVGGMIPDVYRMFLTPEVKQSLSVIGQIGLIFLMLLIGSEFNFPQVHRTIRGSLGVASAGIVVPFGLTLLAAPVFVAGLGIEGERVLPFTLLLATAVSITAIPIMGRILREVELTSTRVGLLSITAAALDDVLGWVLLAGVIGVVQNQVDGWGLARSLFLAAVLAVAMFALGRFALRRIPAARYVGGLPPLDLTLLIGLSLVLAAATNCIGIFSIFGGFLAGVAVSFNRPLADALERKLQDFVSVFFLPIFFMFSGLKTDIHGMGTEPALWMLLGLLIVVASVGKLIPCTVAARMSGLSPREAFGVGILMNTRGLMALVVINIGYDLGVFPRAVFFMLVTMALLTTVVTTPILRKLRLGDECGFGT